MVEEQIAVFDSIAGFNENSWDNIVNQSRIGNSFQRYGWLLSIENGTNLRPRHVVEIKGGNPIAIWPNFVDDLAIPHVTGSDIIRHRYKAVHSIIPGFGGFIIPSNEDEKLSEFIHTLSESCDSKIVYQTLRLKDTAYLRYSNLLADSGFRPRLNVSRFVLDLSSGWNNFTENLDSSRRKDLRKWESSDAVVQQSPITESVMEEFHDRYRGMLNRVGSDPYPETFFTNLAVNFSDYLRLFSVKLDGQTVGEHLYVIDDDGREIHSIFGGIADDEEIEISASTAIHFEVVRWAIDQGIKIYDFGGMPSDFTSGLFTYKEEFGGDLIPTLVWERGIAPIKWNIYRWGRRLYT